MCDLCNNERMWSPTTPERDQLYGKIAAEATMGMGASVDPPDRFTLFFSGAACLVIVIAILFGAFSS